jgi:hypothetical protein
MTKARKPAVAPQPPPTPQVGDKVIPERSEATYVITKVRSGGQYVDLELPQTNLDRFHVDVASLKFVDRIPPKPIKSEPDASEITERIAAVRRENLQRLDDDIAILTKYLETKGAPKKATDALSMLGMEQSEIWNKVIKRVEDLLKT